VNIIKEECKCIFFEIIPAIFDSYLLSNLKDLVVFYESFANKVANIALIAKWLIKSIELIVKKWT